MSHIRTEQHNFAGIITLDRPDALNALSLEMVTMISETLRKWRDDEGVMLVIIRSSKARAFCAGGDVRQAVSIIADNPDKGAEPYFIAEYGFDQLIACYAKPIIALVDGVVMGGGFGVARLARYMVVSEAIKMAMPETAIGLFPDVGASLFLRKPPLAAGLMMGMTGTVIGTGDAIAWQLADYHCTSDQFDNLIKELSHCHSETEISACLDAYNCPPPAPHFAAQLSDIEQIFGNGTPAEIAAKAQEHAKSGGYAGWDEALHHKCPMSIAAFWYLMRHQKAPESYHQAIARDYFLAVKMTRRPDFVEGVRAVLIDKDNQPQWSPSSLIDITDEMLTDLFDFSAISPLPE